jgi:hypothetical protein
MKRAVVMTIVLACLAFGCSSSSTSPSTSNNGPSPNIIVFTAQLLPANETPPIANAELTSSGSVTIAFAVTRDASNNVTSGVGTASIAMQGFPSGSTITLAHIHTGAVGVAGAVYVGFVPSAPVATVNGAGTFSQTMNADGDHLTNIINNPSGYYFNVHTQQNPAGVMRGQLVRTQ